LRESLVTTLAALVEILDKFIHDKMDYSLEWDDFISWENSSPEVEVFRNRVADLEAEFFTRDAARHRAAIEKVVAIRNEVAAMRGIGVLEVVERNADHDR
jgi:hypothetical protein